MNGRLKKYGRWGELHEESELLAMEADRLRGSNSRRAIEVYLQAAKKEEECLGHIRWDAPNAGSRQQELYQSFVASAAALYFKGSDYTGAQRVIDIYSKQVTYSHPKMRLDEVIEALAAGRVN